MNIIVTAQVTYEIYDVDNVDDAISVFQQAVTAKARHLDDVSYIGTKELFATEMSDEGEFLTHPQMWEVEEVV